MNIFGGMAGNAEKKLKKRRRSIDDIVDAAVNGTASPPKKMENEKPKKEPKKQPKRSVSDGWNM